ncbi:hypothetical protein Taro_024114 [Colocasia esculenta]|uniref:Peptidase A1 domain-containing protein n=1 Tax=Colocasia esculenta TaxID=4460 RepID=A0A843VGH8_COLES|nr:hypothetical protein [Colocasia esculenta]
MDLLSLMSKKGLRPNIIAYNAIWNGLYKNQRVLPNSSSYNILVSRYCRRENTDEATKLYNQMLSQGVVPDLLTFSSLIWLLYFFQHVEDSLLNITSNDASHLLYLSNVAVSTCKTVALGHQVLQSANYVVCVCLGKDPQPMLMALDTSNDATWLPCPACAGCPPSSAIFYSTKSSSFTPVPCSDARCNQGSSAFHTVLSRDTLHIADNIFPVYTFGCLQKVMGSSVSPQGLLGLGWGPTSLLSQTQDRYRSTFSYASPTSAPSTSLAPSGSALPGSPSTLRPPRFFKNIK